LVKNSNWKEQVDSSFVIKQGFLSTDPERTVRVRVSDDKAFLTIKGKSIGATRMEFEYSIPHNEALQLLKLCKPTIIEKVRYLINVENHTWELDVFEGDNKGLIIAEIELNSEEENFNLPDWVGEEVTGDVRYYNSNLSREGFMSWE
jgi:CYTH domain-containing protein